jgi:hypothetical protein
MSETHEEEKKKSAGLPEPDVMAKLIRLKAAAMLPFSNDSTLRVKFTLQALAMTVVTSLLILSYRSAPKPLCPRGMGLSDDFIQRKRRHLQIRQAQIGSTSFDRPVGARSNPAQLALLQAILHPLHGVLVIFRSDQTDHFGNVFPR